MNDPNPYSTPAMVHDPKLDERHARLNHLRGPSLALIVLGIVWTLSAVLAFAVQLARYFLTDLFERGPGIPQLVSAPLLAAVSGFIVHGAFCMRYGLNYRTAITAAVLACVPFLSPMIWIGIPFGIWALVVLRRKDVRAAFG